MRLFLFVIVYFATLNLSNAIELNQTVLFQTFNYNHESVYIDLHKESIVSIHLSSFIGLEKLEVLYLQDNRIKRIEKDVFKDLVNLRQLWLESNNIVSFDRDALLGLHNLELVCLNDNPIQELFQSNLIPICNSISNPKCVVKTTEKCVPESTIKPSTTKTEDRIEQLASFFQFDQLKQNEKILNLEEVQKVNNETLSKLLANSFQNNEKIENLQTTHLNDTKMLKEEWQFKYQNQDIKHSQLENKFKNQEIQIETLKKDQKATNETLSKLLVDVFQKLDGINAKIDSMSKKVYSLDHNVLITDMQSQGYRIVYDLPYNHATLLSELNQIKSQCNNGTVLCAGGAFQNSDILLLVSCGNCHSVLTPTEYRKPVFNNGAYWYLTNGKSFGFSHSFYIFQDDADHSDCNTAWYCPDKKKLSWHLTAYHNNPVKGGFRLGELNINVRLVDNLRKILFLK